MKRPLPAKLLNEAWNFVMESHATDGCVNVPAIASAIRKTSRYQNVTHSSIEQVILHACMTVGAIIEFDTEASRFQDRKVETSACNNLGSGIQPYADQAGSLEDK